MINVDASIANALRRIMIAEVRNLFNLDSYNGYSQSTGDTEYEHNS